MITLHVTSSHAEPSLAYTHFSLPFARGTLKDVPSLQIRKGDQTLPAQMWPLAHWPDGSLRVLHGISPLVGGSYQVHTNSQSAPSGIGLRVETDDNGTVLVRHHADRIRFQRDTLFSGPCNLHVDVTWADGSRGEMQLEGDVQIKKQGPLYVLLERWVKVSTGTQYLRFRFQFEFFHGVPGVAVHAMLVNDCPGADFQHIRSMEIFLEKSGARPVVYQKNYGFEHVESRFVETRHEADIRVDATHFLPYVKNHEVLEDANVYPHYLRPPANGVGSAVFLKSEDQVLQMEMQDFHLLRPKGIRLAEGSATFALWPDWAEPLSLQQGKRRQVRLALYWGHKGIPENWTKVQAATAALTDLHRCQLPAEVYAEAEFFDQSRVLRYDPYRNPRFEGLLQALSGIHTIADFFHLGDTKDSHYQTTYMPLGYSKRRSPGTGQLPDIYTGSFTHAQCFEDLDAYQPIWVNNEYDVIFALGTEYLRSGNLSLYQQLRRFSRHTIEVDFVCYSDHPVHHRAQPTHSENHTSTGAYPSHFWTQGLTQYYFLTGDEDALEVVRALADKTIWYFEHPVLGTLHTGINREMGWAVLTLVFAYEATNEKKYDTWARKLIDSIIQEPLPDDMPGFSFGETSFLLGCRAYLETHEHSEASKPVWDWYLAILDLAIRSSRFPQNKDAKLKLQLSYGAEWAQRGEWNGRKSRPGMMTGFAAPDCLAYAYEKTGDNQYLEAGLRGLKAALDANPGYFREGTSFHHSRPEGKPFAWTYRTWINYLGALDQTGMLAQFEY